MTNILDVDEISLTVLTQTGIMVRHLEEALNRQGLSLGPYPVEIQASTLGGLLAAPPPTAHSPQTGRLADACLALSVAHADGSSIQTRLAPRRATGPDIARLYLGSRGGLGVITTAVMRVHRLPEEVQALAFAFPGLLEAVTGVREIMVRGARPARVRLLGAGQAAEEMGETGVALQAACLVVLAGPPILVHQQHCLVDEVLGRVGGMELSQALASRWWQSRAAAPRASTARPSVVGARLPYSRLPEALDAVSGVLRRHKATVWLEEFDLQGATVWLASRHAEGKRQALASALLDLGVDPIRPSFPPLMEELRAALDPHGTLVVMED
jgi:FAD/FMN-containing dehydrogenase